jgi:hypothetical protein
MASVTAMAVIMLMVHRIYSDLISVGWRADERKTGNQTKCYFQDSCLCSAVDTNFSHGKCA